MSQPPLFCILRPSLIFVADKTDQYCHLRGGDNEIYPLQDISNQELLQSVFETFRKNTIANFSDLRKAYRQSLYPNIQNIETLDEELDSLLNTLIDSGLVFTLSTKQKPTSLQMLLVREGVYSDSLYHELQSKKILVATDNTNQHAELIKLLIEYEFNINPIKIGSDTEIPINTHLILGYASFNNNWYFQQIHNKSLHSNVPWFMLRQAGFDLAQIGPIFIPPETACYQCLSRRMNSQRNNPDHHQQFEIFTNTENCISHNDSWSPAATSFIFSQFIIEIVRYFISNSFPIKTLASKSCYFNLQTLQSETEILLKLPSCQDCSKHDNSITIEP